MFLNFLGETMKIVVSVNHPGHVHGHVHLFKNFIWTMQKKGHEILALIINYRYILLESIFLH